MPKKISFSIPYNGDLDLMRWAIKSGQVYEIYFCGPRGNDYSSANPNVRAYSDKEIMALVSLCAQKGIARNFLMNKSILFFEDLKKIFLYLRRLDAAGGITSVTISDGAIVPHLHKVIPNVKIQSSVFLHIDSAAKVREAVKMGITEFCLDVTTNRNGVELEKIKALRKTLPPISIKLLANHSCYLHCFYLSRHADWIVLSSLRKTNPPTELRV
jgi:collagenase-like PrtC family protease